MSWTAPRTWTAGEVVTAAMLNEQIRDNETYLHAFKGARVTLSANQSVNDATDTALNFDTEIEDSDGFHSNVTNNNRLTVPTGLDGRYLFVATIEYAANATGVRWCQFRDQSGTPRGQSTLATSSAGNPCRIPGTLGPVNLGAGQWMELVARQNSGGALNVLSGESSTYFGCVYLGSS